MTARVASRRKGCLFQVILILAVLLITALAGEGLVRLRQRIRYGGYVNVEDSMQLDPATGLRVPIPDTVTEIPHLIRRRIVNNSLGFRSPEVAVPKPEGTLRLAFLGGSTTYCAEVTSNALTWPHLVWERLQRALPGLQLDYVNGAVAGYRVESSLEGFEKRVAPLSPDVVVIYHATNDLVDDTMKLAIVQGLAEEPRRVREPTLSDRLAQRSRLWGLMLYNYRHWKSMRQAADEGHYLEVDAEELARSFEERLTALVRAAQEVAPVVAVVKFSPRLRRGQPEELQREYAERDFFYMPYMTLEGLLDGYDAYNRAMERVAAATGAVLVGGEASIPTGEGYYNDTVHFRDAGAMAMAERVAPVLLPELVRLAAEAGADGLPLP